VDPSDYESAYEVAHTYVSLLNQDNRIIKFLNIIAIIGEKSLFASNAMMNETSASSPYDVDSIDNIPGNRVAKSRGSRPSNKYSVESEQTLAWAQSSTPSMYLLPVNVIRATNRLNNARYGANPASAMLGTQMYRNTYTSIDVDGTANRIPNRVVKIVEDRLDSEYVPFYFHDLRTNEVISFHAFLSTLSDTITPKWNAVSGYGRMDPVQQYAGTTRSLQVGFTVWATNREDFDEMWYKINKLVTMLYPQWSQGTFLHAGSTEDAWVAGDRGSDFYQPFSQVLGASPVIRLRVGDVIKSNYSRFNLARVFGIGDPEVKAKPIVGSADFVSVLSMGDAFTSFLHNFANAARDVLTLVFIGMYGSPHGLIEFVSRFIPDLPVTALRVAANAASTAGSEILAEQLVNGFVNPWHLPDFVGNELQDPNFFGDDTKGYRTPNLSIFIKPNMVDGYFSTTTDQTFYTFRRVRGKIRARKGAAPNMVYEVEIIDGAAGSLDGEKLLVRHEDIYRNIQTNWARPGGLGMMISQIAGLDQTQFLDGMFEDGAVGTSDIPGAAGANALSTLTRLVMENPEASFMRPEVNPFVKGFHQTRGRGLAGVMQGITFNWLDSNIPWETDYNSRAPIGCEIGFNFDVIHDIPPGIAHDGYNRAPLYNVGQIMENISGDVYDELISVSELIFSRGGKSQNASATQIRTTGTTRGGGSS
jgi:hypothetical protein